MRNLIATLLMLLPIMAWGQYYNPYNNPYANQQAYEYGRQIADQVSRQQQQANQQAYNMGRATALYYTGQQNIYEGNYSKAYDDFTEAVELGNWAAYEGLGIMYELGLYVSRNTQQAKRMYTLGANKGNSACRANLNRISNSGYYTSSQKSQWLQNFRNAYAARSGYVAPATGYSSGNIDVDHSCRACNNTGVCNGCHGSGFSYGTTRCNMCHGSGKCMNCGGRGWH